MVRKKYPRMLIGALGIALVALMAAPTATAGATGAAGSSRPKPPSTFVGQLSTMVAVAVSDARQREPRVLTTGTPSAPTTVDCSAGQERPRLVPRRDVRPHFHDPHGVEV